MGSKNSKLILLASAAFLLALGSLSAGETGATWPATWQSWMEGERALDTLAPGRRVLEDKGIFLGGSYTTDLLGNPVGGRSQGFTYFGLLQVILVAELEKLAGWQGGYFVASVVDAAGTDLSQAHVGNYFDVDQVSTLPTLALGQLYLEQRWDGEKFSLKLGRMPIGQDFVKMDMFNLYVGGIDGHTPVFGYNTFWTSSPSRSTWAAVFKAEPLPDWTLRYGIYQATSSSRVVANHGLNMEFGADDGIQMFGETGFKTKMPDVWGGSPQGLAGDHKIGGYWSTWSYGIFDSGSTPYSYGFYWIGEQMVWREKSGTDEGITLWYSFVYAPQTDLSQFPFFCGAGGGWQGALPSRPKDWVLFGSYFGSMSRKFAAERESAGLGDPTYEWVLEWDYRAQVTQWLYVMPSVQYVIRPAGTGDIPNSLVIGAEIGVTF